MIKMKLTNKTKGNTMEAKHSYNLVFDGYYLEGSEDNFPDTSGIYCVYACTYNKLKNRVSLRKLLYIGKAEDFHKRHNPHDKKPAWKRELNEGEMLCYSRAPLSINSLVICEAAMIYKHQPICNKECKDDFHHDMTHVRTSGVNRGLLSDFTVNRTAD